MWMTEKTIQKTVLPLPKTCGESRALGSGEGATGCPPPPPPLAGARCTHYTDDGEEDDDGQAGIGTVGAGVDVWVPLLVELQHAEPRDHVHEGGVCREAGGEWGRGGPGTGGRGQGGGHSPNWKLV